MTYTCPKCGAVSDQQTNCATCNVPMVASTPAEASAQPAQTTEETSQPNVETGAPEKADPAAPQSA